MTPNKERVQKLIDALRSGEFKQIKGKIKSDEGHCCLGVACEVFKKETGTGNWIQVNSLPGARIEFRMNLDDWSAGDYLPVAVRDWYGFDVDDPRLIAGQNDFKNATTMNDQMDWNFNQIADAFERTMNNAE